MGQPAEVYDAQNRERYLQERYNYYTRPDERPANNTNAAPDRYTQQTANEASVQRIEKQTTADQENIRKRQVQKRQPSGFRRRTRSARRRTNSEGKTHNIVKTSATFWAVTIFAVAINKFLFVAGILLVVFLGAAAAIASTGIFGELAMRVLSFFTGFIGVDIYSLFFILWVLCVSLGFSMIVIALAIFSLSGMSVVGGNNGGLKYALLIAAFIFAAIPVINLLTIIPTLIWAYVVKKYPG